MHIYGNKMWIFTSLIFYCILFLTLPGCSPEAEKERHWQRGEQYFSENKMQEAILEYKNVIQNDPRDAKAHYKLGLAYLKAGLFREAFSEVSKTVELDSGMIEAHIQLGNLYLLSGDRKKVKEQADLVLLKEVNNSSAHLLLSYISVAERNIDQAVSEAKKAVEGDKKLDAYLCMLLKGRICLSRNQFNEAQNLFQVYSKFNPKSPTGYYLLAMAHYGNKDVQQAKSALAEATKLSPKWDEPRLLAADIYIREGAYDQAVDEAKAVLKDSPRSTQAYLFMGNAYLAKKIFPTRGKALMN